MRFRLLAPWICAAAMLLAVAAVLPRKSQASLDTPVHGVTWNLVDRISACPAGDTLGVSGHPSRLRIAVWYIGGTGLNKIGVPPESVYVTVATDSGTAVANDIATYTFADDSTKEIGEDGGFTRIQVPSFSGNGKVAVTLYVSGVSQGTKKVYVRTVDTNHDGKVTTADETGYSDINYSGGSPNGADVALVATHLSNGEHWRRQALHGQPMRRTNLRDTGPRGQFNSVGAGSICWSPSGRNIAYSAMDTCGACSAGHKTRCRIQFVHAYGHDGDVARQITYAVGDSDEYDPAWSPRGQSIFYVREDAVVHRKGVPGYNSDTSDVAVIGSTTPLTYLSISPNGDSLAYCYQVGSYLQVFIAPVTGNYARQVTFDNYGHYYPLWSSDGAKLICYRYTGSKLELYLIDALHDTGATFFASGTEDLQFPSFSPDDQIIVAGRASDDTHVPTHTFDATASTAAGSVVNYGSYTSDIVFPHFSPDGARIAVYAYDPAFVDAVEPQIFCARTNMNLPPGITQVGSQSIADTTTAISINCVRSLASTIVITASDPESDAITYGAAFLKDGMSFNAGTHTLTWTPTASVGTSYDVRFYIATPSGGYDAVVVTLTVTSGSLVKRGADITLTGSASAVFSGAEGGGTTTLDVFDIQGRCIHRLRSQAGAPKWDGMASSGSRVANGIYLYRLSTQSTVINGRIVVIR